MIELQDTHLGIIIIKPNVRAKHVIARKKENHILLTVPFGLNRKDIIRAIETLKPKLLKIPTRQRTPITEKSHLKTFTFSVQIERLTFINNYQMSLKNGILSIFVPIEEDILSDLVQTKIKNLIEHALRFEAKRILPQKTDFFAKKFGLTYQNVKINKSRSRWGSCSLSKNINFSFYLLLLNEKQINYVVLHELAHTVEMNHGPRFWALLSSFCGEDAKALSKTMKNIQSECYAYF